MTGAPYNKAQYQPLDTFAFEALSVGATAVTFTVATFLNAIMAEAVVEVSPVRVRLDGTAPTATVGALYNVGDHIIIWGSMDVVSFQAISASGGTATLSTHFLR